MTFEQNPCYEIPSGRPMPVLPWVQVGMENMFHVINGKPQYTRAEYEARIRELTISYEIEMAKIDRKDL